MPIIRRPRKVVRLFGERRNSGLSEFFVLARKERNRACDDESHTVSSREKIYFSPTPPPHFRRCSQGMPPLKPLEAEIIYFHY